MAKKTAIRHSGKALFADNVQLKRVQTLSSSIDVTEEKLLELANSEVAEKKDETSVTMSLECNDYGVIDNFVASLGQGFHSGDVNANRVYTDTDFNSAQADFMVHVSDDELSMDSSEWFGGMFLTSFSLNITSDGIATENYEFEGEYKRQYLNDWANMEIYKADFSTSSVALVSGTDLTGSFDPVLLTQNGIPVADVKDGHTITLTENGGDTEITATNADGAVAFASGDRLRLLVSGTGVVFESLPSTPAGLGGIRRGAVDIFLYNPANGAAAKTLRLQSVSIDADLSREELNEIGTQRAYFRQLERPINITISLEAIQSDLEEYAEITGNRAAYDAGTLKEIDLIDDALKTNTLEAIWYQSEVTKTYATEMKRVKMENLSLNSEESSVNVGDATATSTLAFSAENFLMSGSGLTPFL